MSKVKKKRIIWDAAVDVDIVAHKVFVVPEGNPVDMDSPFVEILMPVTEVLLPDAFPEGTFAGDGNYMVAVAAIDDVGNEGDLAFVAHPFDFIAPGVPTNLRVENV